MNENLSEFKSEIDDSLRAEILEIFREFGVEARDFDEFFGIDGFKNSTKFENFGSFFNSKIPKNSQNLDDENLKKLEILAITAAKLAGKVIMQTYKNFEIFTKDDNSPLTTADLKANEIITKILSLSGIEICSEESILEKSKRENLKRMWVVDPLDGTREFIARNDQFCVCIALVEDTKPIIGVIGVPVSGEIYHSRAGEKVFKNGKKAQISSPKMVALTGNLGKSKRNFYIASRLNLEVKRLGSALKFLELVDGGAVLYSRFKGSFIWDIAAGDCLVRSSGGVSVDLETLKEPSYSGKNLKNSSLLFLGKDFADKKDEILEMIKKEKLL